MFGIDLDSLQSQTEDTKKIMDVIENKFNVKFTFLSGTTSSWENLLGQYIGGGDVPDIFFHTKQEPAYSTWLKDGYLFNYSEYLDDYPNLKAAFARYDEDSLKLSLGGDYYSYPIVMDSTTDREVINEHALFYRRDWYEALKAKNWRLRPAANSRIRRIPVSIISTSTTSARGSRWAIPTATVKRYLRLCAQQGRLLDVSAVRHVRRQLQRLV